MVVVGGGAAGLSAALVLARARRRVVVIDAGGPATRPAAHMHGFLSRDGMAPADLSVCWGGSPEAVQHALLVRQWSPDVLLFPHTDARVAGQGSAATIALNADLVDEDVERALNPSV